MSDKQPALVISADAMRVVLIAVAVFWALYALSRTISVVLS